MSVRGVLERCCSLRLRSLPPKQERSDYQFKEVWIEAEREAAKKRQEANLKQNESSRAGNITGSEKQDSRDKIGAALGISGKSVDKCRDVQQYAARHWTVTSESTIHRTNVANDNPPGSIPSGQNPKTKIFRGLNKTVERHAFQFFSTHNARR